MKNKDRQEILAQLSDAFIPEEKRELRLTTEVVRMDNHNVARVTEIRELSGEEQLYAKYPEAVAVKEMITILSRDSDRSVQKGADRLRELLMGSAEDPEKIDKLTAACRECQTKYYSTVDDIKRQMVLYCFVSELG
ncbi:MAG: hypothetical protein K6E62_01110 [Lachnospiraceae bacterium]|nr:hypothetical protein [Lachnospiraceae bacterium]